MTTTTHTEPNYMAIFWWLLALTIIEISVTYLPIHRGIVGFLLVSLALSKAALVALFFMHLRFEKLTLGFIALTPLAICVFLLLMLLPDSSPLLRPASETSGAPVKAAVAESR